jgi:hypothetical protein
MTVIGERGRQQHLYGMDTEQETFFTAMSFGANGIVLCSLDVVKLEEDDPYTIGYFHLKDHQELVVVIIDKDTGNAIHFVSIVTNDISLQSLLKCLSTNFITGTLPWFHSIQTLWTARILNLMPLLRPWSSTKRNTSRKSS